MTTDKKTENTFLNHHQPYYFRGSTCQPARLEKVLIASVDEPLRQGHAQGRGSRHHRRQAARGEKGYRYFLEGFGDKEFLKMNANAYLGMPMRKEIIAAEERGLPEVRCRARRGAVHQRHLQAPR